MPLNIITADQAIEIHQTVTLLYGQPGIGKSSTAFTANNPLLLDFDRGSYRSEFRKDIVDITTWEDVAGMTEADLKPYKTICVDTVGRLLDVMSAFLIKEDPKNAKKSSGALSLQGYGALKDTYSQWLKKLQTYGKDIVLIAHDKEDRRNDDMIIRPDIQGGSKDEVYKTADQIGYMFSENKQRVLDFRSNEAFISKNSGSFTEAHILPNYHQAPDFLAKVINEVKASLNHMSKQGQENAKTIDDWRIVINELKTTDDINKTIPDVSGLENKTVRIQVKHLLKNRAEGLGFEYDKEAKGYVSPEKEEISEEANDLDEVMQ